MLVLLCLRGCWGWGRFAYSHCPGTAGEGGPWQPLLACLGALGLWVPDRLQRHLIRKLPDSGCGDRLFVHRFLNYPLSNSPFFPSSLFLKPASGSQFIQALRFVLLSDFKNVLRKVQRALSSLLSLS